VIKDYEEYTKRVGVIPLVGLEIPRDNPVNDTRD